jgi:hypothetical protein
LSQVETHGAEIVAKRDGDGGRGGDGGDAGDKALGGKLTERVELLHAGGAIRDAGVLVDVLERGEEPGFVADDGTAEGGDVVLAGEGLLRIVDAGSVGAGLSGILDGEAGVQGRGAFVKGGVAMQAIGAAFGGDDDGAGRGPARVGVFVRGADGEFLNTVGREVLQKAADPVVGVVGTIDGELVVQAGAAAGGDRGDAGLGWIGGFNGLGARNQIGDVGEAACRERKRFEVLVRNDSSVDGAGGIHGCSGDGRRTGLDVHGLASALRMQCNVNVANAADRDLDVGRGLGEAGGGNGDKVGAGKEAVDTKLPLTVGGCDRAEGGADGTEDDASMHHPGGGCVLNLTAKGTVRILGGQEAGERNEHEEENQQRVRPEMRNEYADAR